MHLSLYFLAALLGISQCKVVNLSCDDIRAFVDGHNSRRLQLARGEVKGQPAASNMKYMIWDEELAKKASNWASRNSFSHNPNRKLESGRFDTGENIYWSSSTNSNFRIDPASALSSWFNEYSDYTFGPLSTRNFGGSKQIGHYTQMAWADSIYVGCGISEENKNGSKNYYVVCNYGPAGNMIGQAPYRTGKGGGALTCGSKDCSRKYGTKC